MNKRTAHRAGFTLIEVLVSVSIFAMTMLVATGAVFSIVDANKKTHSLKSVMTNLNFALESMVREIRVGLKYSCDGAGDCFSAPGGTVFRFKANRDVDGGGYDIDNNATDIITFSLDGGRIRKSVSGLPSYYITAPEINVESLNFYVIGTGNAPADLRQPKVVMIIRGVAGTGNTRSSFNIQTTVSQRPIDP